METPQRVKLSDVATAHNYAAGEREKVAEGAILYDSLQVPVPDKPLYNYFFQLQGEVENNGDMDYREYANRMWGKFYGEITDENRAQAVSFGNNMIANLHSIDMEPLVYPHVNENMAMLLRTREHQVKSLSLWSTGDVAATGYQVGKIEQSGVVANFLDAVRNEIPRNERAKVYKKTQYMVDDNKFERLTDQVASLKKEGEENPKIVIIEDASKNFDIVKQNLANRFGENHGVNVVPIWATYSREGQNAAKKAEESEQDLRRYLEKRGKLNAINSFSELLGPGFDNIFQDAHVFVDFDGVIGDNVRMRSEQAKAIYHSLLVAGLSLGLTDEQISQKLTIPEAA